MRNLITLLLYFLALDANAQLVPIGGRVFVVGKTVYGVGKPIVIKHIADKIERIDSTKIDNDGTFLLQFYTKSEGWYELDFPNDKSIPLAVAHGTVSIETDLSDSLTDEEFLEKTIIKVPPSVTAFLAVRKSLVILLKCK